MLVEKEEEMNYKILEISNINDEGEICSNLKMIKATEIIDEKVEKVKDLIHEFLKN